MKDKLKSINFSKLPKIKKGQAIVLILFILIIVILTLLILVFWKNFYSSNDEKNRTTQNTDLISIYILEGAPRIEKYGTISRTIENGENITSGDVIVTDNISKAIVIFPNNTSFTVDNDSRFEISSIQGVSNASITNIIQKTGRIFTRIETINNSENKFEVSMPNAIASVKGTRFITAVDENNSYIYVRKGTVVGKSVKDNNIIAEVDLVDGSSLKFDGNNIDKYTVEYMTTEIQFNVLPDDEDWNNLVDCIDSKISDILGSGNSQKKNYLNTKAETLLECKDQVKQDYYDQLNEDKQLSAAADYNTSYTNIQKKPPTVTAVSDQGVYTSTDKLICSWTATGENIKGYQYSFGTSAGSDNITTWTDTTQTQISIESLGMEYAKTYYCNIKAINDYGTSDAKSSDGIMFDNSSAEISINTSNLPPGQILGAVTYSNLTDDTGLEVTVYVKNSTGKYSDGVSDWADSIVWHSTTKSTSGSDSFDWSTVNLFPGTVDDFSGGIVYAQVKNTTTNRLLNQTTISIP